MNTKIIQKTNTIPTNDDPVFSLGVPVGPWDLMGNVVPRPVDRPVLIPNLSRLSP